MDFLSYHTSRDVLQGPGPSHWLGTNDIGQDVLSGLVLAAPNTILLSLAGATLAMMIAIAVGGLASARNRIVVTLALRLVDILQAMPSTLVLLLIAAWLRPGFWGVAVLMGVTAWHDDVRVLAAVFRRQFARESVQYARHIGAGRLYCLLRHVLPAMAPTLLALFVQNVRYVTARVAGLAFLGLTDPRLLTWGGMLQDGVGHLYEPAWLWLLVPPCLCLSGMLLSLLALGARLEGPRHGEALR